MRKILLALALPCAAWAEHEAPEYVIYTPPSRHFSCEIPAQGWRAFEQQTPRGVAVHLLGPTQLDGSWRAAYHIHFFDKDKTPQAEEFMKLEREKDKEMGRTATPATVWRVDGNPARLFEVRETRMLPANRLPAAPTGIHHYYALFSAGGGTFMVKLSTSEDDYLDYRKEFKRFLKSFKILGYD